MCSILIYIFQVIRRYCSQNFLVPNAGGECCLRRVASLTLDKATIEKHVERPKYLPQQLDFSLYEKFQGSYFICFFSVCLFNKLLLFTTIRKVVAYLSKPAIDKIDI